MTRISSLSTHNSFRARATTYLNSVQSAAPFAHARYMRAWLSLSDSMNEDTRKAEFGHLQGIQT